MVSHVLRSARAVMPVYRTQPTFILNQTLLSFPIAAQLAPPVGRYLQEYAVRLRMESRALARPFPERHTVGTQ